MKKILFSAIITLLLSFQAEAINITKVSMLTGNVVEVVRYYESGEVMETGYMENGELTGKWMRYSKEGVITAEASYKKGQKHGVWKIYDNKGILCYELSYKNNIRMDAKCHIKASDDMSVK